jgi:hypothetical protein
MVSPTGSMCWAINEVTAVQMIMSGTEERIDVADMRQYVHYSGGYSESDKTIQLFWEVFSQVWTC